MHNTEPDAPMHAQLHTAPLMKQNPLLPHLLGRLFILKLQECEAQSAVAI